MPTPFKLAVENKDPLQTLQGFFATLLGLPDMQALLVPRRLPMKPMIMPTLVSDPEDMAGADPLAPAFPMNAAKIVSRLTRKPAGAQIGAVLRPCEIRAFVELVKLNQGSSEELLIIGIDCLGAYGNRDYAAFAAETDPGEAALKFREQVLGRAEGNGNRLTAACRACEHPLPAGADIRIGHIGIDPFEYFLVEAQSPKGEALLAQLKLETAEAPPARAEALEKFLAQRHAARDEMFAATREATNSLEKLTTYLSSCVNCYNCRVACPVCYCKECVFVTDVFNHEPAQYVQWARRKGAVKMPTDTVFYHITRLAHMSTACVGCGQCSNACPNDIPVMELFQTVAAQTQKAFEYEAGMQPEAKPPLSVFREDEFNEVVGIGTV